MRGPSPQPGGPFGSPQVLGGMHRPLIRASSHLARLHRDTLPAEESMRSCEPVSRIMTEAVVVIDVERSVGEVLDCFCQYPIHHLPLVRDGRLEAIHAAKRVEEHATGQSRDPFPLEWIRTVPAGIGQRRAARRTPCSIARRASSSAATSAPSMRCTSMPAARSGAARSRSGS